MSITIKVVIHHITNINLLKKRLVTTDLKIDTLEIGRYTKSKVAICYLTTIADKKIVKKIKKRLEKINIDGVLDSYYLQEYLEEKPKSIFKQVGFTEKPDISKFLAYVKWLRKSAGKKVGVSNVNYSLMEVLAEYKRRGVSKSDIIKAMMSFNPLFLAKEIIRRKKSAKKDIEKCVKVAESLGLSQTAGTKEFPIFEK
jgi:hypothetical protein